MALTKEQKVAQLADLKDKLGKCTSVMFAHYIGLNVGDVGAFRESLRGGDAEMKVAKKTLMKIAAEELKLPALTDELLNGPVACIFSYEDPLAGAQLAFKFSKDHPQVELIGGIFEGNVLTQDQALVLAKIPGKQQLLGMFAAMCNGPLSSFARGLSEIAKQKEAPASAEASASASDEATADKTADKPASAEETAEKPAPAEESAPQETPAAETTTDTAPADAPTDKPAAEAAPTTAPEAPTDQSTPDEPVVS